MGGTAVRGVAPRRCGFGCEFFVKRRWEGTCHKSVRRAEMLQKPRAKVCVGRRCSLGLLGEQLDPYYYWRERTMGGKAPRDKGKRGQREARALLDHFGWDVGELQSGEATEDFMAIDPYGKRWAVEVKNAANIMFAKFRKQAREQASKKRSPWMLMCRIPGYNGCFYVERAGHFPVVWRRPL